jgi:hypothetical protein
MALSDELETDEYASKHLKAFFYNRARPDFIVYPKADGISGGLKREEVMRVEKDFLDKNQGFWRAFRPYFMTREVGIHEFEQNFQHMQMIELLKHERDTIIQVFGFPPELFGILESSNRATIEGAELMFARWCVEPRLEFQRSELQAMLVPEYDERLILDYVSPVAEDKEFKLKVMVAMPTTVKVDEWREFQGLTPLEEKDGGENFIKPGTMSIVENLDPTPLPGMGPDGKPLPLPTPPLDPNKPVGAPKPKPKPVAAMLRHLTDDELVGLLNVSNRLKELEHVDS